MLTTMSVFYGLITIFLLLTLTFIRDVLVYHLALQYTKFDANLKKKSNRKVNVTTLQLARIEVQYIDTRCTSSAYVKEIITSFSLKVY